MATARKAARKGRQKSNGRMIWSSKYEKYNKYEIADQTKNIKKLKISDFAVDPTGGQLGARSGEDAVAVLRWLMPG